MYNGLDLSSLYILPIYSQIIQRIINCIPPIRNTNIINVVTHDTKILGLTSFTIIKIKAIKNHNQEKINQTSVANLKGRLENENIASSDKLIILFHEYPVSQ